MPVLVPMLAPEPVLVDALFLVLIFLRFSSRAEMAVSVPPPLFQLSNVVKFRDDAKASTTPTATTTLTLATTPTLKSTKNKRKSMEPKKLSSSPKSENSSLPKRPKLEASIDGSDGEPTHSPGSTTSNSDSHSSDRMTVSPQCQMRAPPKMRFKQEALKYLEDEMATIKSEKSTSSSPSMTSASASASTSNPFRPWDIEVASPTLKTSIPSPNPFLYSSLQNFFPPGFLAPILNPALQPTPPVAFRPKLEPKSPILIPKVERRSPSPSPSPAAQEPLPTFDAETRQVLSRLYPFLLNRGPSSQTDEPEQDEPLALVKRNRSDDDEDDVFLKQEASDSGNEPGGSSSAGGGKSKQRNYKNMTRERRIEANARERQRVHTITAAFDRLQSAIPTTDDGSGSKLSKLSVIKIATSYIMVLSRMAGLDYSMDQSAPSVEDCIRRCAELVKAETKSRKKSSESSD